MNKITARFLVPVFVSLLAAPSASLGQSTDVRTIEEIIVTAQKREQRLIEVPMSVSLLNGTELEQRGLNGMQDIAFAVPGVTTREDGPGSYQIFMRGLANQYGPGALVSVYFDEVPISVTGNDQLDIRTVDLDRVEVLKGPQGTLYGQGAVAGTVRLISKAPALDRFEGRIEGSVASIADGSTRGTLTGILNLPIIEDVLALRLVATFEEGGGWVDQPEAGIEDGNETELTNIRAKALWQVNEMMQAEAMLIVHKAETRLGLGYEEPDRTTQIAIDPAMILLPKKFDYDLFNINLKFDLGFAEFLSASSYIDHDHQYPFSYIGGAETIYGGVLGGVDDRFLTADQFSQELRLVSTAEGPLRWTLGAFYRDTERTLDVDYAYVFSGTVVPDLVYVDYDTYESIAIYAEASYDINDRFEAGAGVRYFEDDQTTFDGTDSEGDGFDSVDGRIYLSYAISKKASAYGSISTGFRSGGFNAGELPNYQPESLINYEIGTKAILADGAVDFELALYYSDYEDMLRRGLVFLGDCCGGFQSLTSNIGKAEITGFEAGFTWRATDNLTLNATLATIDSEIVEVNATDATNIAGDGVDYVPDLSYTLGAQYSFDWAAGRPGFARVDYSYRDQVTYIDRSSFPEEFLPQLSDDIGLLDARIGITLNRTTLELFGNNLTDENKTIDPYVAWSNANRTRPRMVGLKVRFDFD